MLGGVLTSVDWRLVFVVNLILAIVVLALTARSTPDLRPDPGAERRIDFPGAALLAGMLGLFVFGLSQGAVEGWNDSEVVGSLAGSVVLGIAFVFVERRSPVPLIEFRLFRRLNFLAANISQMLAGFIELGLGYLLPYLLLLVVGVDPAVAGIALIPATIPIILMGPLAGRAFDRFGGRWPLVVGYLVLAASGVALAIAASDTSATSLIPGLVLQGIGLGIVLTVNDPTGLTAVDESDQGAAAGMINTSEQLGGAVGIAVLLAVELEVYFNELFGKLADKGIDPTTAQDDKVRGFIFEAEREGLEKALADVPKGDNPIRISLDDLIAAHVSGFEAAFLVTSGVALVGAIVMFALVRKSGRKVEGRVFTRRSRWVLGHSGMSPGLTRKPPGTS